jgi:D-alanyl-D-alanine carboxypeptidase
VSENLQSLVNKLSDALQTDVKAGFIAGGKLSSFSSSEIPQHFIASTTKTFTSVIVMKMVEQGEMALDQPVSNWIEDLSEICHQDVNPENINVRALLSHTSGIPDYYRLKSLKPGHVESQTKNDPGWDFQEVMQLTAQLRESSSNQNRAEYSGTNYQILEKIIESKYGGYEEALKKFITGPLGLEETFMFRKSSKVTDSISELKYASENYLGYKRLGSLGAEGGLVSSIEDTLLFFDSLFSGRIIDMQSLRELTSETKKLRFGLQYGAGVMVTSSSIFGQKGLIGHIGATGHFAFYSPKTKNSFAGTINNFNSPKNLLKLMRNTAKAS